MLTVILTVTSDTTDVNYYKDAVGETAALHIISICRPSLDAETPSIIGQYNSIIKESDLGSDILLLSDQIDMHGDFDKFMANMRDCLYATEKHAIVYAQEIENRENFIKIAKKYLPKYSVTANVNEHCALIKKTVLKQLGMFNEEYNNLHYALMDYCRRIGEYGYSTVAAHHALVSYNSKKQATPATANETTLKPEYPEADENFKKHAGEIQYDLHPCLVFLKTLDNDYYPKKRILFDCIVMPANHCGTSEYQISVFESFYELFKDKYDIFLYVNYEADKYHKLSDRFVNVLFPDTLTGVFHLGFAPFQLVSVSRQTALNKHCLYIIQTVLDIIMLRGNEHKSNFAEASNGIMISDGIAFISEHSKDDFLAFFASVNAIHEKKYKVIYPATGFKAPQNNYELPFDKYFLITGNSFKHKVLKETLLAVRDATQNFIVVGYDASEEVGTNIHCYPGGHLDEDFLSYLYANCQALIFPSLYEGFGLPIAIALKNNKRVIVNRNSLNEELSEHFFSFKDYFYYFDYFEQISDIIEGIDFSTQPISAAYNDSWTHVAKEYESFFSQILDVQPDIEKLCSRWNIFNIVEAHADARCKRLHDIMDARCTDLYGEIVEHASGHAYRHRGLLWLMAKALKTHLRNKHPKSLTFLKKIFRKPHESEV